MKIGIFGTGMVGQSHAARLGELGHEVMIGTRNVKETLARNEKDTMGNPGFADWHKAHDKVQLGTFAETAAFGEIVLDCLKGEVAVATLKSVTGELKGKILMDIANALDFSKGMPPTLLVCNTDSLGEQVQKALPDSKVVKTCNTTNAILQTHPEKLADGDHHMFLCGNDADAKAQVTKILQAYGWKHIIDLGDITNARGMEMLLPMWLRLWGALKTPMFNFKIVQG